MDFIEGLLILCYSKNKTDLMVANGESLHETFFLQELVRFIFCYFLLYLSMSTSPIIGLVIGHTKINLINSIIMALGMILALIFGIIKGV